MTDRNTPSPELIEQAKALAFAGNFSPDDLGGDVGTMTLRNPDGPAMFAMIESLLADRAKLEEALRKACDALEVALEPWHGAAKTNGAEFIRQTRAALRSADRG